MKVKNTNHEQVEILIRNKLIPIDVNCIGMVEKFNAIGLNTKYCCENPYYIMFEDYITDKQIIDFIDAFENKYHHSPFKGRFEKWCRKCDGKIILNWTYRVRDKNLANIDLKIIKKGLNKSY